MDALCTLADSLAAPPNLAVMLAARVLLGVGIGGFWAIGGTVFLGHTFISPFLLGQGGLSRKGLTVALFVFGGTGLAGNFLVTPLARWNLTITFLLALLVSLPALLLVLSTGGLPPTIALGLWGLGYGAVPVALQTWIDRSNRGAFEAGSSLYIAVFQGSIAIGSLLGAFAVASRGAAATLGSGAALALARQCSPSLRPPATWPTRSGARNDHQRELRFRVIAIQWDGPYKAAKG